MDFTKLRQICHTLGLHVSWANRDQTFFCVHLADDASLASDLIMAFRNPDGSASNIVKVQQDHELETWSITAPMDQAERIVETLCNFLQ